MEDNTLVKEFYESHKEDEREGRETLEFMRSKSIISRYLAQDAMEIADVCGATGAYSFWLADMGHRVHLLDLAPKHIEIAKNKAQEKGLALASYACADARELPYGDESMDLVLLMGALYHLLSREARMQCLNEAFRVLKPGGFALCTVISRYTLIISSLKYKLYEEYTQEYLEKTLRTGIYDKANFYMHTPGEIGSEIASAGFETVQLIAVEGVASALGDNQLPTDEKEAERLFWSIDITETAPELLGVSRNVMAVGKKP